MQNQEKDQLLGKRVKRNIFNVDGTLLINIETILTQEHLHALRNHGVELTTEDVYQNEGTNYKVPFSAVMEETVSESVNIFQEVRNTRRIPLAEIRQNIIPAIYDAVHEEHFLTLFSSLQAKDDYTYRHNIAVGVLATLLGSWLGLAKQDLLQLTTAGVLHDVGKMLIPDKILNKPGKLTAEEFEEMKKHTIYGYELIKKTPGTNNRQALVALQHHERMDGSGYPLGLTKDKIDLFSRIVSVVDVFHAMTSKRVYRDPSPFYEILISMENDAFGVLDAKITKLFIEKIMNYLSGNTVLLTDGREGRIIMIHPHEPTRPLIQVGNQFIDLRADSSVRMEKILY